MPVASPHQGRGFGDEGAPGPAQRRRPSRPATLLLAVALAASLATACSKSDSADGPTADVTSPKTTSSTTAATTPESTTTQPATTTTAPPTPEQKVEAAFLKAVALTREAAKSPDAADPRLSEARTGASLDRLRENFAGYQADGIHIEYVDDKPPVPVVESVEMRGPSVAAVTFCVIDDARQVRADGEVVNDVVSSQRNRAEMRFEGGTWKIAAQRDLQRWADGEGCDR